MTRKPLAYTAIAALVLTGAYLGTTAVVAHKTHAALEQLQHMGTVSSLSGFGSFHDVKLNEGFWSSSLSADMDVSTLQGVQSLPIQATIDQWPAFSGPVRGHLRFLVPDFGPVHTMFAPMHAAYLADGNLKLSWLQEAAFNMNMPAMSGNTADGALLKWAGANLVVTQKASAASIKASIGDLSIVTPKKHSLHVGPIDLAYAMTPGLRGQGVFDLDVHGAQLQGVRSLVLHDATAHCAMSWDAQQGDARRFISVDQARVAVHMKQPEAMLQAHADATLPITEQMSTAAAISPLLALPTVLKALDGHLQVQADDGAMQLIPALAQQAQTLGASKQGSLWTVQAEMQGGHVTVDGKSLS